ncbi:MAG: response regulator [Candidatus Riflebacteria bacterium]|nr:response regulator [Candidatus Riflebacteria bacterium]
MPYVPIPLTDQAGPPSDIHVTTTKQKILVVDDEENILEILALLLERGGYAVTTAPSPSEALELLRTLRPDLIISDVNMPGMDGYTFFRTIQENPELSATPFLFLTARGGKEDMMAGKELGADDYLVKPLTGDELLASVRGKLRRVQARELQQRERVESLKREILNVLSHEFVTPLVSIKGTTDLLLSEDLQFGEEELRGFLMSIRKGGDRLGKLVADFIMSAKLQAGTLREEAEALRMPFALGLVVSDIVNRQKAGADAKGIGLELAIPESPVEVDVHEDHIRGILERLLDNAVKFSAAGAGPVQVTVSVAGRQATVSVADHGMGIPPEQAAMLFQPFQQVNRKKMEQQGPGLGLSLARGLAEANHGQLTFTSQPGAGSTFVLTLPLKEAS